MSLKPGNKPFRQWVPYLALWLVFTNYLRYWADVMKQCQSLCGRGYDDAAYYQDFLGLFNGSWPGEPFFQSPLPGVFLGLLHKIFQYPPESLAIPYLIQMFIAILTCALAYSLAREAFSPSIGVVTILLLGFYEFVGFYATTLEANTLIAGSLTATLYFLTRYRVRTQQRFLVIAAICLGLTILGRTNNLALIGAVALWLILIKVPWPRLIRDFGLFILVTGLVIFPAVLHSSRAAGSLVLITTTGVYNFTMGNLPGVSGAYSDQATHSLEPALRFITEQPLDWLVLTLRKFQLFFTFPWSHAPFLELPLTYIIGWSIGIGGYFFYFFSSFTRGRSLLHLSLIFYTASIIVTHVEDEYRVPGFPLIFIFAGLALVNSSTVLSRLQVRFQQELVRRQLQKPGIVWVCSVGIIGFFIGYLPGVQTTYKAGFNQEKQVYGGTIVGQSFQVDCPNLHQIAIRMFLPVPGLSVDFHLREGVVDGPEIYRQTLNTDGLTSAGYYEITFPEILNSAGKSYTFYFDTSTLKSSKEALILFGSQPPFAGSLNRVTPGRVKGGAFIALPQSLPNIEKLEGNLVFTASCRASPAAAFETAIDKLSQKTSLPRIALVMLLLISTVTFLGSSAVIAHNFLFIEKTVSRNSSLSK